MHQLIHLDLLSLLIRKETKVLDSWINILLNPEKKKKKKQISLNTSIHLPLFICIIHLLKQSRWHLHLFLLDSVFKLRTFFKRAFDVNVITREKKKMKEKKFLPGLTLCHHYQSPWVFFKAMEKKFSSFSSSSSSTLIIIICEWRLAEQHWDDDLIKHRERAMQGEGEKSDRNMFKQCIAFLFMRKK